MHRDCGDWRITNITNLINELSEPKSRRGQKLILASKSTLPEWLAMRQGADQDHN
jgi:hypothetical protein